jgi:NADH:quinone reductase (non-electrogenic)
MAATTTHNSRMSAHGRPTRAAAAVSLDEPGVVVVGAGFGGMEVGKSLQHARTHLTIIDRKNYTLFQPLLYQVATAALSPADVAVPLRSLLRSPNTEILLDDVLGVDAMASRVRTVSSGEVPFKFLVLATGSQYNYFGHHAWQKLAPSPKSLDDALVIRRRLLLAFEHAEMCRDDAERRALMTFVVIGAGATGVEMAGAMAELAKATLVQDFRRIDPASARVLLIEAGPRVLAGFSEELGTYAEKALAKLGVELRLNTKIDHIDSTGVVAAGEKIATRVVVWGAGVKAIPVAAWLGIEPTRHGTVAVNPDFSIPGHSNVFVVGDAAHCVGPNGKPLPGLAAVAKQEGQYVGEVIRRRLDGQTVSSAFRYRDYGTMATIGRSAAVADLRGLKLKGRIAWLLWGVVHLYFLIGFRNRLLVLVNWFWAWLTYARGARLITQYQVGTSLLDPCLFHADTHERR